ncbi:MAG: hypothetical protein LQ340_005400, partial [Diploschistes diacapsis]
MDYKQWYNQLSPHDQRAFDSIHGKDFTPSPSSVPSLAFSPSTSVPSSPETDCALNPWLSKRIDAYDCKPNQGSDVADESEEQLQYVYDSQNSTRDPSLSNRARNRASGGFFSRLLQKGSISNDPVTSDHSNGGTDQDTEEDSNNFSMSQEEGSSHPFEKDEAWPLPLALDSDTDHLPESPIL